MSKIIKHAKLKCLECGKIIESKHRHDFVKCGCKNEAFVDGGYDYFRYGAMDIERVEVVKGER